MQTMLKQAFGLCKVVPKMHLDLYLASVNLSIQASAQSFHAVQQGKFLK